MLRNYLLLAYKVLRRRKFYTFISLFGIALTLMVLTVVTALIENVVHPNGPEGESDSYLIVSRLSFRRTVDGEVTGRWSSSLGYRFVEDRVMSMETPALVAVHTEPESVVGFREGGKITSSLRRANADYWKVLNFEFLEGRPFNEEENRRGDFVAVISRETRERYFPQGTALGGTLELDGLEYEVIGVVEDVPTYQLFAFADVWVPVFATRSTAFRGEEMGGFGALLKASSPAAIPAIKEEYRQLMAAYRAPDPRQFPEVHSFADTRWEFISRNMDGSLFGNRDAFVNEESGGGAKLVALLAAAMLLFMFLPVINLVNINGSRILERASEIGVRKSFGASSSHLVRQFLMENLLLTALGGLLGFLLAYLALQVLSASGLLWQGFGINHRVFMFGLLYVLVFGFLSGVGPAWRMSRLDPVLSLRGAA